MTRTTVDYSEKLQASFTFLGFAHVEFAGCAKQVLDGDLTEGMQRVQNSKSVGYSG
jgi:hypothetical protein